MVEASEGRYGRSEFEPLNVVSLKKYSDWCLCRGQRIPT